MKCTRPLSLSALSILALSMSAPILHAQTLYNININTTGLSGTQGGLAFDFIGGDNLTPNNTAVITNFVTNGTLTGASNTNTGNVSGNLPGALTLRDSGFSESFRGITFGSSLSYTLSLTNNFAAPGAPDEFSFFLTNAADTNTVVTTSDPTGANALFVLDARGTQASALTVFTPRTGGVSYSVVQAIPEPSALVLAAACLVTGSLFVRSRRRQC